MTFNPQPSQQHDSIPMNATDDDYEIITSEEVDRVLDALDQLMSSTESENIRSILELAADQVYGLVYEDEEELDADDSELSAAEQQDEAA